MLGNTQIHKYAEEHSQTFLVGWFLVYFFGFLCVFVGAQMTNVQIHKTPI